MVLNIGRLMNTFLTSEISNAEQDYIVMLVINVYDEKLQNKIISRSVKRLFTTIIIQIKNKF